MKPRFGDAAPWLLLFGFITIIGTATCSAAHAQIYVNPYGFGVGRPSYSERWQPHDEWLRRHAWREHEWHAWHRRHHPHWEEDED